MDQTRVSSGTEVRLTILFKLYQDAKHYARLLGHIMDKRRVLPLNNS